MKAVLQTKYDGVALVTGASSGLGASFARSLARRGYDVVLVARRAERLEALAEELRQAHRVQAFVILQDLSAPDAAQNVTTEIAARGLKVGLLVNNAGFGSSGKFHQCDAATELSIIDVNCRAYVAFTAAFLPQMVARGNGGVIFVSSTCAPRPVPNFATYGATKAFALSFGQAVAADAAGTGVDVLTFVPGYIRTEFHATAGMAAPPQGVIWNEPNETAEAALSVLGSKPLLIYRPTTYSWTERAGEKLRRLSAKLTRRMATLWCGTCSAAEALSEVASLIPGLV